jgi:hypothetical protein
MKLSQATTQAPDARHDPEFARLVRRGIEIGQTRRVACLEVDENLFDDVHAQDDAGQLKFFEVMK